MGNRSAQTLILFVDNEFGVLTRVTALVRREGWNIKSLSVGETQNPAVSRLTLTVECLESTLPRVLERLGKLACVRGISAYAGDTHISRELVMATVGSEAAGQAEQAAAAFGASVIERGPCGLALAFAGEPARAEAFLEALRPFGVRNVARSGVVALEREGREEA